MAPHAYELLESRFSQLRSQISSPGNRVAGTDHAAKVVPFLIAADTPFGDVATATTDKGRKRQ
jgi:hypothetical protein